MLAHLSLLAAVLALTSAAPSATTAVAAAPTAPPLLPLPAFSGTFANKYPAIDVIADTTTPQAQAWIKEINMTAIPSFPVVPFNAAGNPVTPSAIPADSCDWTETGCYNKDLVTCPLGVWGLTYDDGPTEFSPQLYDFLDTTNQKATLFYIGSNVFQNWQSARRACGAGHQIAVHTWSHQPSTSLTNEQFIAEIKYTEMIIKELCGFTPKYFRPPYGDIDNRIRGLLWAMGYTSVIWDYDTNDWQMAPGGTQTMATTNAEFAGWIANATHDTTGHITLEHELYQNTVTAAINNLPKIQATWKTMPVSACMNDPHPYRETNITFATINGGTTGLTAANTSTTTVPAHSGSTAAGTSTGASPTTGGKSGSSSGAGSLFAFKGEMKVFAVIAGAAIAFGQMLL